MLSRVPRVLRRSASAVLSIELPIVSRAMSPHPVCIRRDALLHEAAEIVAFSGVSDLMVVSDLGDFVGVLSSLHILRAAMPDTDEILAEGGTLDTAFDLFVSKGRMLAQTPIEPRIVTDPITLRPDQHIAEAATLFVDKGLRLLPVVKDGRLMGTVSRADVCRAVVGIL